jgi:hypothetical protein
MDIDLLPFGFCDVRLKIRSAFIRDRIACKKGAHDKKKQSNGSGGAGSSALCGLTPQKWRRILGSASSSCAESQTEYRKFRKKNRFQIP